MMTSQEEEMWTRRFHEAWEQNHTVNGRLQRRLDCGCGYCSSVPYTPENDDALYTFIPHKEGK